MDLGPGRSTAERLRRYDVFASCGPDEDDTNNLAAGNGTMRNIKCMAVVAMCVAMVLAGTLTAAARKGGRRGNRAPQEDLFDTLVRECKIPEARQAAVKAKVKAYDAALAAWDKTNAAKVQAANDAAKEARQGTDADAKKKTLAATRELKNARAESASAARAAVIAALNDDQKAAWAAYDLFKSTTGRYRRAELTEAQLAKIKAACAIAAKEIGALDPNAKPDKAARAVAAKLRWAIDVMVLTPRQREAMSKPAAGRGGRGRGQQ